ncbi:hypothetical protein BJY59DRAFT_723733 [Rhodotorula toruloides]
MSAASPPPPPDPNRFNPFASTCGSSPSSSSRRPPLLRRSKTVANPESPLRWRREPLADVTNLVLGRRENWTGRLQYAAESDGATNNRLELRGYAAPEFRIVFMLARAAVPNTQRAMSDHPRKDEGEVTNPKHVFNDPRHRRLAGGLPRSATSHSQEEPTSPRSKERRKAHFPGRRQFGALANVLKPRRKEGQGPESHSRPKSRDLSWSDWPIDPDAARRFNEEHKVHDGHEGHEAYYNSDDEDGNREGERSGNPDRRTPLLPPLNRHAPQYARHSATPYRQIVQGEEQRVHGDEEEAQPKWT